jgi:hypothetical protein
MGAGESDLSSTIKAEWAYKSRTYTAQIETVSPEQGTVSIRVIALPEKHPTVTIPLAGFGINKAKSSWVRYMPQKGEFVEVSFGPKNEVYLENYLAYGEEPDPTSEDGQSGSPTSLVGGYATVQKKANRFEDGLSDFQQLAEGEWDMRSKGGAYIRGFAQGPLLFRSGGMVTMRLDKGRDEIATRATTHSLCGDGVDVQFGDVKRVQPPALTSSPVIPAPPVLIVVPDAPTGAAKEWRVRVGKAVTAGPTPLLYEEHAGYIADDDLPYTVTAHSGTTLPLRYLKRLRDDTGLAFDVLKIEVDHLGNVKVVQNDVAVVGGVEIVGGELAPLVLSFNEINLTAADVAGVGGNIAIDASMALDLTGTMGVNINAGGAADEPMVRGTTLTTLIKAITVPTALGPSGPPLNLTSFGVLGTDLSLLAKVK